MTEEGFRRKLTSILSADAVGYSRLMEDDEEATVRTLTSYRKVLSTLIRQHNGIVVDSPGDNILAEFASVVDAVQCAVSAQNEIDTRNDDLPDNRKMQFRMGVNLGDVIQEGKRIYGDGVNIAARLEGLAKPDVALLLKYLPFKSTDCADIFADGFLKAGCPGKPSGYYKIYAENRLTGKEIGELTPGYRHNAFCGNIPFSIEYNNEGGLAFEGFGQSYGGTWWIKDYSLCQRWERPDLISFDDCSDIYRNPDSKPESRKGYIAVYDHGIYPFSVEKVK